MVEQQTFEMGNGIIVLTSINDSFSDGHTTGYLEFYDERHRPSFPLTSQIICDHLMTIFHDPCVPVLWKAGRIVGWIEALMENAPQTFRSVFPEDASTEEAQQQRPTQSAGRRLVAHAFLR
ncbi:MAG TPA: hypothetical protein VFB60_11600 [Ktedonobacteraceae bacterium]|nr:hypothetical protein [Ktedonobacteraceae bacterium]